MPLAACYLGVAEYVPAFKSYNRKYQSLTLRIFQPQNLVKSRRAQTSALYNFRGKNENDQPQSVETEFDMLQRLPATPQSAPDLYP